MKTCLTSLIMASLCALPVSFAQSSQDNFGSGANQFTMDFRTIGDAGNANDDTGYGSVGYGYRMSTYEVSREMVDAYNGSNGGPVITMFNYEDTGFSAPNDSISGGNRSARPATGVSWNEAARFVNWLNTSNGHSAAYNFTTSGSNDNIALWTAADAGYNASNPFRNSNAYYFLPSEDEWYKAAYYDPDANGGAGGYWDFATGSNTVPTAVASGTTSGTAVYGQSLATGPADVDNAGGLSAYGTMAQNGNAWEWGESGSTAPNDSAVESRVFRGGRWSNNPSNLPSSYRNFDSPTFENFSLGFRVASVPEPSSMLLSVLSLGVFLRRKRS